MSDHRPSPAQKPRTVPNAPAGGTPPHKVASPPPPAGAHSPDTGDLDSSGRAGGQRPVVDDGTPPFKQSSEGVSGTTGPFSPTVPEPTAPDEAGGPLNRPIPGADGGINEGGAMAARMQAGGGDEYDCEIPGDPLAPKLTVRATSEGDAEKKYRDKAGIINTRHTIKATRK